MNSGSPGPAFEPVRACWVCEADEFTPVHRPIFELSAYAEQDPELAAYTGSRIVLRRCRRCGFGQPDGLPVLPRYFDRMYDQRWAEAWIRDEFESTAKDYIFAGILASLGGRLPVTRRRLLDVGAHAGRFVSLARRAGWAAEGLELNPQTAAYAAKRTGAAIRQLNVHDVDLGSAAYDAVAVIDVLEHIPDPVKVLIRVAALLAPGGWAAVKVPSGPSQLLKETWRGRLRPGYRPTVADNLVHVSHFSPGALRRAMERAGFSDVVIEPGAPELPAAAGLRGAAARARVLALHHAARLIPRGVDTPIAFNLQAYGRRP